MDPDPDLTIVLLGNTGVGKSATGNSILRSTAFESKQSFRPVTKEIREERGQVCEKQISVVDTPGILGSGSKQDITTLCQKQLSSSTPCLFLVVVRVGRFTKEEVKAVNWSISVLGDIGLKNSFLLFTGGDKLNESLHNYIFKSNRSSLREVVKKFEDRYLLFNNRTEDKKQQDQQVQQLLDEGEKLRSCELPGPKAAGLEKEEEETAAAAVEEQQHWLGFIPFFLTFFIPFFFPFFVPFVLFVMILTRSIRSWRSDRRSESNM